MRDLKPSKDLKIVSIVGARPNFMKVAPFVKAIEDLNRQKKILIDHKLIHTGQHYDPNLSDVFFQELGIPKPDFNLNIGSGSHAEQIAKTMMEFEKVCHKISPDWVVVIGDVNATISCSIVAKKLGIKVCHIESGLRSYDMNMPEEINRIVTDSISDLLLTPDRLSSEILLKEGKEEKDVVMVGNIMIDSLISKIEKAQDLELMSIIDEYRYPQNRISKETLGKISKGEFGAMTLHRPSNVDRVEDLTNIVETITNNISRETPIVFTVHPRTLKQLEKFDLLDRLFQAEEIVLLMPVSYLALLKLNSSAQIFLTDSGGIQEECSYLGTPCLTLRVNTERPITLNENGGSSILVGKDRNMIIEGFTNGLKRGRKPSNPEAWDGNTAKRSIAAIVNYK